MTVTMKGFTIALLMCLMSFSILAQRGSRTQAHFRLTDNPASVDVHLSNLEKLDTKVAILGVDGHFWLVEYVYGKNGFAKTFNFSGMPDGDYIFNVQNKGAHHFQGIAKYNDQLQLFQAYSEQQPESLARPVNTRSAASRVIERVTALPNKQLHIQLANLLGDPFAVRLLTDSGIRLKAEFLEDRRGYSTTWDFSELNEGRYYLYLQVGKRSTLYLIKVDAKVLSVSRVQKKKNFQPQKRGRLATQARD